MTALDALFEVCTRCDHWQMYHRAEDGQCPVPPIYEADSVTKRRQYGPGSFTSSIQQGGPF